MSKLIVESIKIKIKLGLTADDWQLYSDMAGRDRAAKGLNRAVERKLAKGEINSLAEVLYPYSKWGAADSEGYDTLYRILEQLGFDRERLLV